MNQTQQILDHMKRCGSITPLEALREYGCMRLGARIWDLKRMGHRIRSEIVTDVNRNGEAVRFAQYTLEDEAA